MDVKIVRVLNQLERVQKFDAGKTFGNSETGVKWESFFWYVKGALQHFFQHIKEKQLINRGGSWEHVSQILLHNMQQEIFSTYIWEALALPSAKHVISWARTMKCLGGLPLADFRVQLLQMPLGGATSPQ